MLMGIGPRGFGEPMKSLPIVEKFVSLQGEGPTQGMPTSFIRVAGCNLKCRYCDSKYSWNISGYPMEPINSIYKWVAAQWPEYVCITGGEPLLYITTLDLIDCLDELGYKIVVETNGTVDLESTKNAIRDAVNGGNVSFVMDYKSSEVILNEMQATNMLKNLRHISDNDAVKFVISPDEIEWALEIIEKFDIKNAIISPIVMLPADGTWTFPDIALTDCVRQFMEGKNPDVRFQIQTHKLIYGNQRGV